jgi:hypothetical protein
MSKSGQRLTIGTVMRIDEVLAEVHALLANEMIAGTATRRVREAEQKLHDLRNEFAALAGLGFRLAFRLKDNDERRQRPNRALNH